MNPLITKHFSLSGLNAKTIAKLMISYVNPNCDETITVPVPSACIPYFDLDGQLTAFYRLRTLTPWTPPGETKPRKYMQAASSGNHLYLPPLLQRLWREIAADKTTQLLITEGEKKAACACLHGFATIGLGGVWNWRSAGQPISGLDQFDWRERKVFIAFDSPDIRTNLQVAAALAALSAELRQRGADVRIVELPCDAGKKVGLDDFLVQSGKEPLTALLDAATAHLDVVSELNEHLALVWIGAKPYVLREVRRADGSLDVNFAKTAEVRPGYADRFELVSGPNGMRQVNAFDQWLRSDRRRTFTRVVFEPGGCQADEYNLWSGFSVLPQAGDCDLYLQHIREIICQNDQSLFDYVTSWMAHLVQRPGELPGTALVLRGRQGTGKGTFVHTLGALLQSHYLHLTSQRHLLGNFNAHTKNKLLFFADEAFWAGDKAAEGTLKGLVTEPTRILEHKGQDALIIQNYARLVIASNHEWVVPAGPHERRFVILDVSDAQMQNTDYFDRIKRQMNRQGLAALLHHLQQIDLSKVDLRAIPKTAALLETKLRSQPPIGLFWYECLCEGRISDSAKGWDREVPCKAVYAFYSRHTSTENHLRRAVESELGRTLKRLVPDLTDVRRRKPGDNATQERHWIFPSLADCRAAFCEHLGQKIDWPATGVSEAVPKFAGHGSPRSVGSARRKRAL